MRKSAREADLQHPIVIYSRTVLNGLLLIAPGKRLQDSAIASAEHRYGV
jgi:hypothetical protein